MDIFLLILNAVFLTAFCILWWKVVDLRSEIASLRKQIIGTHQTKVKSFVRSSSTPKVDARARTVSRRDIPAAGGRVNKLTKRRDYGSVDYDGELHPRDGHEAASKWELSGPFADEGTPSDR